MPDNLTIYKFKITKALRNKKNNHNSFVIWLVGLSGSGKSTIANALEQVLYEKNCNTYVLDGDNIRLGINNDLGFTDQARKENIRRVAEIAKLIMDAGVVVLSSFISPFEADRQMAKSIIGASNFIEVFVDCPIDVCEQRDSKGLYSKARKGEIKKFTGIDSPFETPQTPYIHVLSNALSVDACVSKIFNEIEKKLWA